MAKAAPKPPQCPPDGTVRGPQQRNCYLSDPSPPCPPARSRAGPGEAELPAAEPLAPGRPPLPRPALLPPPLERRALTATSGTRVRDCGQFQTACRALRKEEGAGSERREGERAADTRSAGGTATHAGSDRRHTRPAPRRPGQQRAGAAEEGARAACAERERLRERGERWWAGPCIAPPRRVRSAPVPGCAARLCWAPLGFVRLRSARLRFRGPGRLPAAGGPL